MSIELTRQSKAIAGSCQACRHMSLHYRVNEVVIGHAVFRLCDSHMAELFNKWKEKKQ